MSNRTSTPWKIDEFSMRSSRGSVLYKILAEHSCEELVYVRDLNNSKDNATFIVKAVNAHDRLVEALEKLLGAAEGMSRLIDDDRGVGKYAEEPEITAARAILAEVKS